jgi:hypothetical protein
LPPAAGSKKCAPNRRSRNSRPLARFSAGSAKSTMKAVATMAHTKIGTRLSDMPGARSFSAVTMKLIAVDVVETPSSKRPRAYTSMCSPGEFARLVSGA